MCPEKVELGVYGKTIKARCLSSGVTSVGTARPMNAAWEIEVDGARCAGFPGDHTDTEASVKARLREWAEARPGLFPRKCAQ